MAGFIFKPSTRKGPVFLTPTNAGSPPTITLPDGTVITAVRGDQAGGVFAGHDGYQYVFPREVLGKKGAKLNYGGQTQLLDDTNMSYRGTSLGNLQASTKGAIGSNDLGALTPGSIGYGSTTADLSNEFPSPTLLNYSGNPGNFEFTDPMAFAQKYGDFNRNETRKNFNVANDIALKELDLELAGMKSFIPAASALKRNELSLDNAFNQSERTKQVNTALPGVRQQLADQSTRAQTFARGEVPDSITDRALELGIRSNAADLASAGGFGANSRLSGKISDLMSADKRIQLSQYGDQLLGTNIDRTANLFLAPTSYSDAGQQIKVTPTVDLGTRTANNLTQLNSDTLINPTNALSTTVNQREFNATNKIGVDQFNASTENTFKNNLFSYRAGLAGEYAGANQTDINTNLALEQQKRNEQIYQDYLSKGQRSQNAGSIGSIIGGLTSLFGSGGALSSISDLFKTNTNDTTIPNFSLDVGSTNNATDIPVIGSGADTSLNPAAYDRQFDFNLDENGNNVSNTSPYTLNIQREAAAQVNNANNDVQFLKASATVDPQTAAQVTQAADSLTSLAGIYREPAQNRTFVGNDNQGKPVYADTALLNSTDTSKGGQFVDVLKGTLDPLGVFSKEDTTALDKVGAVASDANFINNLSTLYQSGDKKGFIAALGNRLGTSVVKNSNLDPSDKAGLTGALTAYNLYNNWDRLSSAQKSLAITSLGLQGYKYATGESLASKNIITPTNTSPGLNVGQALDLFASGVNVYGLVNNWDQMNTFQKVTLGTGTAAQVASTAKNLGLLGAGTTNAAVPGITAEGLSAAGFTAAPQVGVGAITGSASSTVPAGYTVVANEGGTITAVPTSLADSAAGVLQTAGGVATVALGAKTVYDGWQGSGRTGVTNGALGGSAVAAGLYTLGATNPYLLSAIVATSIIGDSTGGKKSNDQKSRDASRDVLVKNGLANKDYQVTLADGTKYDIGVDGHGQQFEAKDPSKLVNRKNGKLNAWDIDYTNDLDFASGMGGTSLSRLLHGGTGKSIDQLGGQLGNAAVSSVGHGKEMTPDNFNKVMTNLRAMYAQSGIKTKKDAYQLANQAFAEKRINDTELVSMQQTFNMMFDKNGYDTAQKLMSGRFQGIQAVKDGKPEKPTNAAQPQTTVVAASKTIPLTKEQIRARNAKNKLISLNGSTSGVAQA